MMVKDSTDLLLSLCIFCALLEDDDLGLHLGRGEGLRLGLVAHLVVLLLNVKGSLFFFFSILAGR